jgi:putative redox protein
MKEYRLSGIGKSTKTEIFTYDSTTTSSIHPIATDVPKAMGGGNTAPQPVELLLASLCGCEQVTAEFVARHLKPRVNIEKINFEIFASRNQKGAITLPLDTITLPLSRLEQIWGTATVHTTATQEQIDIIAREIKRRCPIANMIILSGCKLDIKFIKACDNDTQ